MALAISRYSDTARRAATAISFDALNDISGVWQLVARAGANVTLSAVTTLPAAIAIRADASALSLSAVKRLADGATLVATGSGTFVVDSALCLEGSRTSLAVVTARGVVTLPRC